MKSVRLGHRDELTILLPGQPGAVIVITTRQESAVLAVAASVRVRGVTEHNLCCDLPCDRPAPKKDHMPEWMTLEEVAAITRLRLPDLSRLRHHLDANTDGGPRRYSAESVKRLMTLYKLPAQIFMPTPPDLSREERWTRTPPAAGELDPEGADVPAHPEIDDDD